MGKRSASARRASRRPSRGASRGSSRGASETRIPFETMENDLPLKEIEAPSETGPSRESSRGDSETRIPSVDNDLPLKEIEPPSERGPSRQSSIGASETRIASETMDTDLSLKEIEAPSERGPSRESSMGASETRIPSETMDTDLPLKEIEAPSERGPSRESSMGASETRIPSETMDNDLPLKEIEAPSERGPLRTSSIGPSETRNKYLLLNEIGTPSEREPSRGSSRGRSETLDKDLPVNEIGDPTNGDILIADGGEGNLETLARLVEEESDMSQKRPVQGEKLAEMGQQADLLERQKLEFEFQLGELQAERDLLSKERGVLEDYVSDLRNRIQLTDAEHQQISEQKEIAWETERQGLVSALSQSAQRIFDLAAAVEDLQTSNDDMIQRSVASDGLVIQVSREEEQIRTNFDLLNRRVEMLMNENESLRMEIELKAQAMWSLEGEVRSLRADIAAADQERETLRALNSTMESETATLESRLADALELKDGYDSLIAGLRRENNKLESDSAKMISKIDEMQQSLEELSRRRDDKRAELENLVAELQPELAATRSAHEEASMTSREIREDIENLANKTGLQCKELEDDLISLRSSFERMKQADSDNQQRINDLEQQVSTLASEKRVLEDANRLLQIELDRRIVGSAAEDHEQFDESVLKTSRGSANMDGESRDVKAQESTLDHPAYQLLSDGQVGKRIRDLEIALDAAHKALAYRTEELQSLQSCFETQQKGKQIAWPAVAASTSAVVAAAYLVYAKYSKQR